MGPFIQPALSLRQQSCSGWLVAAVTMYASCKARTIATLRPPVGCSASNYRLGGGGGAPGAGAGNAESAGAGAAPLGGFGFFGRMIFFFGGFGGGPAGRSSAVTGLGSTLTDAGVVKSPGNLVAWTGTVAGWNPAIEKVTENPPSGIGTGIVQGVLQLGPTEVRASAPCGVESNCTCAVSAGGGLDLK
jgi:hypothetical protein